MNKFEKHVPSLEICRRIPAGMFSDSALVWKYVHAVGVPGLSKLPDSWIVTVRRFSSEIPAPALPEILDELSDGGNVFLRKDESGWMVMFEKIGDEEGYGYEADTAHDHDNPADAALRLWMRVNGDSTNA